MHRYSRDIACRRASAEGGERNLLGRGALRGACGEWPRAREENSLTFSTARRGSPPRLLSIGFASRGDIRAGAWRSGRSCCKIEDATLSPPRGLIASAERGAESRGGEQNGYYVYICIYILFPLCVRQLRFSIFIQFSITVAIRRGARPERYRGNVIGTTDLLTLRAYVSELRALREVALPDRYY